LKHGLSVRKVEELAKAYQNGEINKNKNNGDGQDKSMSADFDILKQHLSATFKTKVKFTCNKSGRGQITFPFNNDDELARLISIFDSLK
jgi:ParB family chromosome partitioning protein